MSGKRSPIEGVDVKMPSPYGEVRVWDLQGVRRLSIDGGQMSLMNLSDPREDVPYWEYLRCMEAAWEVQQGIRDVLLIGGGAGSFAMGAMERHDAQVDISEINPVVHEAAVEYFGLSPNGQVHLEDGRVVVKENGPWDLITLDVAHYRNHTYKVPYHLGTREFFELAKSKLTRDGVVVTHIDFPRDNLYVVSTARTMRSVFSNVVAFDCNGGQVLVAFDHDYSEGFADLEEFRYEPDLSKALLLTDEFSPIIFAHETT